MRMRSFAPSALVLISFAVARAEAVTRYEPLAGAVEQVPAGSDDQAGAPTALTPRVVEFRIEPDSVAVGEPFDLVFVLRFGPGTAVLMPDTLLPAEGARSLGAGAWTSREAAGDSMDVQGTYPMIGFQQGLVTLPAVDLLLGPANTSTTERVARASAANLFAGQAGYVPYAAVLGAIRLQEYAPLANADSALVPRPAADVVGGEWSVWLLFGLIAAAVVGAGGLGAWATGWWSRLISPLLGRTRSHSPRQEALRELDRIRALGWHRNGRVDDFYAASTGTLRHYAGRIDTVWVPALTSGELLRELEGRWGEKRVAPLVSAVHTAERVKFGLHRPEGDAAEADWKAIREWINAGPAS
jgi:hypothetical protein